MEKRFAVYTRKSAKIDNLRKNDLTQMSANKAKLETTENILERYSKNSSSMLKHESWMKKQ
jgi:hypothetical protein